MKFKIKEGRVDTDKIDQDGDGIDDRLDPKFTDFEIESMQNGKAMVKILANVLDELKVLAHTLTPAGTLGKSSIEKAAAQLSVAEGKKPWEEEPVPNPKGRSPIRPQDADMVFKSSEKTYSLGWNYVRLPWGVDLPQTMAMTKNIDANKAFLKIPQDGIHAKTKKPYSSDRSVKVDMKVVKVDPEGRFMDIPLWHYVSNGIALKNGDLIDTEGRTVATREEQVKLARAYVKWPKPPSKTTQPAMGGLYRKKKWGPQKEHLKAIEDALVEYLLEIDSEDKDS